MNPIQPFAEFFDTEINSYSFPNSPKNLYDPLSYFLSLGGKRIRPLLTLMSAELFHSIKGDALHASMAIEFFHNFSLIHDDIMDKAPLRRGKETVHLKWNDDIAILSGDVLLIKAYQELAKQKKEHIPALLTLFNQTAVEVCEGQQMDMDFERAEQVSISEYIEMIRLKTSVLLGCALEFGAIIADANENDRKHIYSFGQNLGIAFQIQDDILDLYGDPEKFGKQIGGDILSNKKTILLLKAIESANKIHSNKVQELLNMSDSENKIAFAKQLFEEFGVVAFAKETMKEYQHIALESLDMISVTKEQKQTLIALAEMLLIREI
jgi:geranylgeranyl diphosphate synthase, type II